MEKRCGIVGRIAARALMVGAALFAVSLLGMAGAAAPVLSNSGGGTWEYYKQISVLENSGNTLTDYQVLVQLSGSNFPTGTRSDGADIRFTDTNGNELSYWIGSFDYSGRSAKIWVRVPTISAGGTSTVRIYYGNPSAMSSSNIKNTFWLGDDFNDASIDTNLWYYSGNPSETNGDLFIPRNPSSIVFAKKIIQ